jgi:hypothetical protein
VAGGRGLVRHPWSSSSARCHQVGVVRRAFAQVASFIPVRTSSSLYCCCSCWCFSRDPGATNSTLDGVDLQLSVPLGPGHDPLIICHPVLGQHLQTAVRMPAPAGRPSAGEHLPISVRVYRLMGREIPQTLNCCPNTSSGRTISAEYEQETLRKRGREAFRDGKSDRVYRRNRPLRLGGLINL